MITPFEVVNACNLLMEIPEMLCADKMMKSGSKRTGKALFFVVSGTSEVVFQKMQYQHFGPTLNITVTFIEHRVLLYCCQQ